MTTVSFATTGDVLLGGEPLLDRVRREAGRPLSRIRVALGYLYVPGLLPIWDALDSSGAEIQLLIGNTAGTLTDEQQLALAGDAITAGRPNDVRLPEHDVASSARVARAWIVSETSRALRQSLAGPPTADSELPLLAIARSAGTGRLRVRIYPNGRLHAKAYLFEGDGAIAAIIGSTNVTLPASGNPTELNVVVRDQPSALAVAEWFDALWSVGQDFTRELVTEILAATAQ